MSDPSRFEGPRTRAERTGMLVIRMWRAEPGGDVHGRIRHTVDVTAREPRIVVARGPDAIREEVLSWLEDLLAGAPAR